MATVQIKSGNILGTTGKSIKGDTYYKFLGIPYATPPVGNLRFKAPRSVDPWQDTRDCTKDGNVCLSLNFVTKKIEGSEDCLYLNVHTRAVPSADENPLKAVLVYIHGGGFTAGTGTEMMAGADLIMTEDVVFVSMNYRLGIFGFLSLEDASLGVTGNNGLKDQTFALKWVKENIKNFGGDPDNVTIFGISAGGASVQFQLLSPTAKGLFHKAIAQSGSVFNTWSWGQKNAISIANMLGKTVTSEKEALEVLMETSAEELAQTALTIPEYICDGSVRRPFGPVIETPNPEAFLCEDPAELLRSGRFNQVPLIQGVCQDEGLLVHAKIMPQKDQGYYAKNVLSWNIKKDPAKAPKWQQMLRELYYPNGVTEEGLIEQMGDILFNLGVIESTKIMISSAKNPIFLYMFAYDEKASDIFKTMIAIDKKGVSHGYDSAYLLSLNHFPMKIEYTPEDVKAIEVMVGLWSSFARTGKPHLEWEEVTDKDNLRYLRIAGKLEMLSDPFGERMKVWHEILEEAGGFDLTNDEIGN
ncbi:esterase E4-like [Anthonomus grandis grandis]|uniref:esterase E4-like n=1 Tax=Anthonomus grandis grandis TaxID=2921223 RepID=UPI00216566AE|nr:esterase E4-like [Anthonomus grandis grandis]